ncbi:MAG: SpaH/EbpB family LPXTG-anchored major pilin [Clostridium sp.]|nr:SpaH/EbpB family LPXTG-anchored major pilin [Clostridium sp.]
MKIKNNIKRILSIVVSMLVMASLFTVTSFAAEPTTSDGTIDTTQKGSLKIVKYEGNDTTKPLAGVTFTYAKVADIEQIISDKTNTIAYSVEDSFKTTIGLGTADYTINSKDYYKAETIQNALKAISYEDMKSYAIANGTNMTATDANGESTASSLALGLYVVVETAYPSKVDQPSNPFLVSLPSTVGTVDGNGKGDNLAGSTTDTAKKWIYDVVARPKNTTSTVNIYKDIVIEGADTDDLADDKVEKFADYNIGDKVTFKITADVPKDITKLKTYKIVDKLSDGLTYNKVLRVYGIKEDGSSVVLNEGLPVDKYDVNTDYIIEVDGQNITIKFVKRGALGDYTQVCVDLEATLNENAVVGDEGNPNNADLKYSKDTSSKNFEEYPDAPETADELDTALETVSVSEAPKVYTYAINLTKYIDEVAEGNKIDGVEFELQDKDGNAIMVKQPTGTYYLKDNADDASNTVLVTDGNGEILVKGLDAGIYYLKETKTKAGYNLLKDKIKIEIKSEILPERFVEDENGNFIEIRDTSRYGLSEDAGNTIKEEITWSEDQLIIVDGKKYLDVGTQDIYMFTYDQDGNFWSTPATKYSMKSKTFSASEATYGIENGVVKLNVVNKKGFDLPTTGGMGTWLFTIGGLVLMAGAGVLFAKGRKSTER